MQRYCSCRRFSVLPNKARLVYVVFKYTAGYVHALAFLMDELMRVIE